MTRHAPRGRARHAHPTGRTGIPLTAQRTRGLLVPFAVLLASLVATWIGVGSAKATWNRLPTRQLKFYDAGALNRSRQRFTGAARQGILLAATSDQFAAVLQKRAAVPLGEVERSLRSRLDQLPGTHLGRLQLAALAMLTFERAGTPIEQWWRNIAPLVEPVDGAKCLHFMPDLIDAEARAFEAAGFDKGTAHRLARSGLSSAHATFLQYVVTRLDRVGGAQRAAGNVAAATACERVTRGLLAAWVRLDGPEPLRVLAADLFARSLVENPAAAPGPSADLATALQAWRAAYRDVARAAADPPPPLAVGEEPVSPLAAQRLVRRLAATAWLGYGSLAAGVAAVLSAAFWALGFRAAPPRAPHYVVSLAAGVALAVGGVLYASLADEAVYDDLRRWSADPELALGSPRLPWAAGVVVLAGALVAGVSAGCIGGSRGRLGVLAHLGLAAGVVWLVFSVGFVTSARVLESERRAYERALATPLEGWPPADTPRLLEAIEALRP